MNWGLIWKIFAGLCKVIRWITRRKPNLGKFLIVEDDPSDALMLERALRRLGYDCEITDSGEVASGLARQGFYRYIFIDLRLPGMSGEALIRIFSDELPNAKLVVVCGEPADLRDIPEGMPVVVIRKNVSIHGLTNLFKMLK